MKRSLSRRIFGAVIMFLAFFVAIIYFTGWWIGLIVGELRGE